MTYESKAVMGTKPDGSLRYTVADMHHVHGPYNYPVVTGSPEMTSLDGGALHDQHM